MSTPRPSSEPRPQFEFESDLSGRLFCWLIDAEQVDLGPMIEYALSKGAGRKKAVKRLADALEEVVADNAAWAAERRRIESAFSPPPRRGVKAPAYRLVFRPTPLKKLKFKEVARALLAFHGKLPEGEDEAGEGPETGEDA